MSKNNSRRITLVRGPIWEIHSLTLIISCYCRMFFNLLVKSLYSPASRASELNLDLGSICGKALYFWSLGISLYQEPIMGSCLYLELFWGSGLCKGLIT